MASRSAPNLRRAIRRFWCWTANSKRNPSIRCFSSRNAASPGTIGRRQSRARARRAVALRGRGSRSRYLLGEAARPVQAGAHQRAVCLYRRRIRRTRPYPVPALCRAGGDVLRRPAGAAGPRPLSAIPGRHQTSRLQDAHADRGRSRDRQDPRIRRRPRPGWRRPRQFFGHRGDCWCRRRDRHLRHSESRRHHGRAALARRDRGIDARLRHAADDDGAGGADRRSVRRRCRSTRSNSGDAMRSRPAAGP